MIEEEDKLVRIFINETDMFKNKPLFEVIINKALELGIAGATMVTAAAESRDSHSP